MEEEVRALFGGVTSHTIVGALSLHPYISSSTVSYRT